jgi:hypothetical protein
MCVGGGGRWVSAKSLLILCVFVCVFGGGGGLQPHGLGMVMETDTKELAYEAGRKHNVAGDKGWSLCGGWQCG